MGKFTVWIVLAGLAWLGWTLWRLGRRRAESSESRQPSASGSARPGDSGANQATGEPASEPAPEPILRCAHCGLYLPSRDTVAGERGAHYCSTAHRDLVERPPRGPSASR